MWAATGVYVAILAILCNALPPYDWLSVVGPLGLLPLYIVGLLAVGNFTLVTKHADLTTQSSSFPTWMMRLPVRARVLVGWLMFNGTATLIVAWLVVTYLILRPCRVDLPLWPVLLAPTLLAWLQMLIWSPFAFPLVRLFLIVVLLTTIGLGMSVLALFVEAPVLLASQATLIAFAYALAMHGVARARRGDGIEAHWLPQWLSHLRDRLPRRHRDFASPAAAQFWFEWRRNGIVFPWFMGSLLVIFGPVLLAVNRPELGPEYLPIVIGSFVLLAPAMSGLFGSGMGKGDCRAKDLSFPSFLAVRPLSSTEFVRVKFRMTALSAFVACSVGFAAALAALLVNSIYEAVVPYWREASQFGAGRAWGLLILSPLILFLITWKNLAGGMWISMTGRAWVHTTLSLIWMTMVLMLGTAATGLYYYPAYRDLAMALLPWLAGVALLARFALRAWVVCALQRERLVTTQRLALMVAAWFLVSAGLFTLIQSWMPPGNVSPAWLAAGCAFAVPFAQLAITPLALRWNRHR
jgi:hypothetical protein